MSSSDGSEAAGVPIAPVGGASAGHGDSGSGSPCGDGQRDATPPLLALHTVGLLQGAGGDVLELDGVNDEHGSWDLGCVRHILNAMLRALVRAGDAGASSGAGAGSHHDGATGAACDGALGLLPCDESFSLLGLLTTAIGEHCEGGMFEFHNVVFVPAPGPWVPEHVLPCAPSNDRGSVDGSGAPAPGSPGDASAAPALALLDLSERPTGRCEATAPWYAVMTRYGREVDIELANRFVPQ